MERVIQYFIVTATSPTNLILEVNKKINEGWQPIGGVSTIEGAPEANAQVTKFMQAMVSYGK